MQAAAAKVSKEEKEAQKAAERAAKEAVKARKNAIKSLKATYKEYAALLRSKDINELKSGLVNCANEDFMVYGGGLAALVKASKTKASPMLPGCYNAGCFIVMRWCLQDLDALKIVLQALSTAMAPRFEQASDAAIVCPPNAAAGVCGRSPAAPVIVA